MEFLQCDRSHFTPIKLKGMFDLLMDETFHCKGTAHAVGHKIKISFLKKCSKSIL